MNVIIDTIYGKNNTYYKDSFRNTKNNPIVYRVVALDSCLNPSLFSKEHNTMFLNGSQNYCERKISLSWNAYSAWISCRSAGTDPLSANRHSGRHGGRQFGGPIQIDT